MMEASPTGGDVEDPAPTELSVRYPPITGPSMGATTMPRLQKAMALPRSSGGKTSSMTAARAAGARPRWRPGRCGRRSAWAASAPFRTETTRREPEDGRLEHPLRPK